MKLNHFLLLVLITGIAVLAPATPQLSATTMTTQRFEFVSNGNRLSGFADQDGCCRTHLILHQLL